MLPLGAWLSAGPKWERTRQLEAQPFKADNTRSRRLIQSGSSAVAEPYPGLTSDVPHILGAMRVQPVCTFHVSQ
eukprot:9544245-Heterocapsa_arctica.AAC.1